MKRLLLIPFLFVVLWASPTWAAFTGSTNFSTCDAHIDISTTGWLHCTDGQDLSDFVTNSGTTGAYIVTIEDSSGNKVVGNIGSAQPSGATKEGVNLLTNPDNEAAAVGHFDNGTCYHCISGQTNAQAHGGANSLGITPDRDNTVITFYGYDIDASHTTNGKIYVARMWSYNPSGQLSTETRIQLNNSLSSVNSPAKNTTDAWVYHDSFYLNCTGDRILYRLGAPSSSYNMEDNIYLDDLEFREVNAPGEIGAYVTWTSKDASFDPNDTAGHTITISAADDGSPGVRSRSRNRRVR